MRKHAKESVAFVLLGKLNPEIFQPLWFSAEKLIRKSEGEKANIELIHPDATVFTLDWVRVEVLRNKVIFRSLLQEQRENEIADLLLGTFKLLQYTPLYQLGINKEVTFFAENKEAWNKIGNTVAPKNIWNNIVNEPGMANMTMESQRKEKKHKGFIRTKIEPVESQKFGVKISVNDHYEINRNGNDNISADDIISIFEEEWKNSLENSNRIINNLMEKL